MAAPFKKILVQVSDRAIVTAAFGSRLLTRYST